ncbi:MAG: DUF177 domain-containing protein [Candidatus Eisenbacteria bacterium]|nr:DUF177 domain-containing protein [Candidatus Eisenbacteria bacterium]
MKIDVPALKEGENSLELRESASSLDLGGLPGELKSDVLVTLTIHKRGDELVILGKASGVVSEECSRCLRPYDRKFSVEFEVFCDKIGAHKPRADEEQGETYVAHHDGKTLDMGPIVREAIVLSSPMQPLCREDCRGLCPVCGVNLNEQTCSCAAKQPDARWSALAKLKKEGSE